MKSTTVIETIKHLSENTKITAFSSFILSQTRAGILPDYLNIDLMEVPRLVPHVFVLDVLNSSEKLLIKYCGTKIDEFYGCNMTGKYAVDYYQGTESFTEIEAMFWQGIREKKPTYTVRSVHLENERVNKFKVAETIMFPCSTDTKTINYAIGLADFFNAPLIESRASR